MNVLNIIKTTKSPGPGRFKVHHGHKDQRLKHGIGNSSQECMLRKLIIRKDNMARQDVMVRALIASMKDVAWDHGMRVKSDVVEWVKIYL